MFTPRLGQKQLQPLDFEASDRQFALRQNQHLACRQDHRMGAGQGARQVIGEVIWELYHKE